MCTETVTCPNYMAFARVGHCLDNASLRRVLRVVVMDTGLSLDDAPNEIIR